MAKFRIGSLTLRTFFLEPLLILVFVLSFEVDISFWLVQTPPRRNALVEGCRIIVNLLLWQNYEMPP